MHQIFEKLQSQEVEFSVRVSFLELYNEELFDLLSAQEDTQRLRIFEDAARKVSFGSSYIARVLPQGFVKTVRAVQAWSFISDRI